jgi:type I restriction enzyme R subunit
MVSSPGSRPTAANSVSHSAAHCPGDIGTAQEHHLEDACLEWLANAGWATAEGEAVAPGGEMGVRERWSDMVLREATIRLNPGLLASDVDAAVMKIAGYGHQSPIDGNREL